MNVVQRDSEERGSEEPATCKVIVMKSGSETTWKVDERECTEGFRLELLRKKYFDHTDLQALTQGMLESCVFDDGVA